MLRKLSFSTLVIFIVFMSTFIVEYETIKTNPVLLVSFDGLRASHFDEFLKANPTSNFQKFINNGVKAEFMKPSFPSLTFPNHWTLVTNKLIFIMIDYILKSKNIF